MHTETVWQKERRAARRRWWRQVLDRPAPAPWDQLVDEMVHLRFRPGPQGAVLEVPGYPSAQIHP